MERRIKFLILYFNLNGISSLKYSQEKLEISRLFSVFSFFLPFLPFLSIFIFPNLYNDVFQEKFIKLDISTFLKKLLYFYNISSNLLPFIFIWTQIINLRKMKKLISLVFDYLKVNLSDFDVQLVTKSFFVCLRNFWILMCFFKVFFFFCMLNFKWKSIMYLSIFQWNEHIFLFFIQFVFLHLIFVKVSIQSLMRSYHEEKFKFRFDVAQLESNFLQLHEIMIKIGETYGFLLSLAISFIVFFISSKVSQTCFK